MSDNLIETIPYRGHEIKIFYDTDRESPDAWGNDERFLVYAHRDFTIKRKGFDCDEIWEHINTVNREFYEGFFVFPINAYIHGGVSLSLNRLRYPFNDRWDVSMKGFILIKREKGCWTRAKALSRAESLIKVWNEYLLGEVYGFDCEVDSCWGYYGSDGKKEMILEAKSSIDHHIKRQNENAIKQHLSLLKTWIRNRVPLYVRQPLQLYSHV